MKKDYSLLKKASFLILMILSLAFAPSLCMAGPLPTYQFRSVADGDWSSTATWEFSGNSGSTWQSGRYPDVDNSSYIISSILVEHQVNLTASTTAKNLSLSAVGALHLGIFKLSLTGSSALAGTIFVNIHDNTSYGHIDDLSSNALILNNLTINTALDPGHSTLFDPTSFTLISTSNGSLSGNLHSLTLPENNTHWTSTKSTNDLVLKYAIKKWFKSNGSGDWESPSSWLYSEDLGGQWVENGYPNGTNVDSIFIENLHTITLSSNSVVAKNLQIITGGELNIGTNTLTLSGNATIAGTVAWHFDSESSYGKFISSTSGKIDIDGMSLATTTSIATEPTGVISFNIIDALNATVTDGVVITNVVPSFWDPFLWVLYTGNHSFGLSYDPTQTALRTTSSSPMAIVSNGKLIYNGGTVYTTFGTKVASSQVKEVIALQPGIYLVKSGNRVQKVIVR